MPVTPLKYGPGGISEIEKPNSPANVTNQRNTAMIQQANTVRQQQGLSPINVNSPDAQAAANLFRVNQVYGQQTKQQPQNKQITGLPKLGSTGGAKRGGGGAAAAPTLNQGLLDWIAAMMRGGQPGAQTANTLDLPDYAGMPVRAFDPSMWQQALGQLNQGEQTDLGTAANATQNMINFLNTNYTNPYANMQGFATNAQAPGATQLAMQRMLQGQGVNPNVGSDVYRQGQTADQAFGNLWQTLGAAENIAQRGRLSNAQLYGNQAADAIRAAAQGGRLGLNIGQAQAQSAWQQRADERAYQDYQLQQQLAQQEAMANWERGNTVQDANTAALNSYRNSELTALLGLVPELIKAPGLSLPDLAALGMA